MLISIVLLTGRARFAGKRRVIARFTGLGQLQERREHAGTVQQGICHRLGQGEDAAGPGGRPGRPRPAERRRRPGRPVGEERVGRPRRVAVAQEEGAGRGGFRPDWLLNVSNDAWFGATSGPWQHLNIASYRAIEEGLPIVRSTPTGVSAVIDAHGRIVGDKLGLGEAGIIDARLPPPLKPTVYSRLGEAPLAAMLVLSAILAAAGFARRAKN